MKKNNNINTICFQASFWPSFVILFFSIAISAIFINYHLLNILEKEIKRHELIGQVISTAIVPSMIINNSNAVKVILDHFKKKYELNTLVISNQDNSDKKLTLLMVLESQNISSSWRIQRLSPSQYLVIDSKLDTKIIIMPLLTSMGIIILFIVASITMYRRIKEKLNSQIVLPINQTLSCEGNDIEWFAKNSAAAEIVVLYNKTNEFIRKLHKQRDIIEEQNIKQAKYDVALQLAHDIRSPILSLETISDLFSELTDDGKALIKNVTKRISQIADDILKEHQPYPQDTTSKGSHDLKLSISEIVSSLYEEKKSSCSNKEISFELTVDDFSSHTIVNITENLLNRVLSNIIDNSIESIQGAGVIQLNIHSDQDNAYLHVQDTGQGIPPHHLESIFIHGFSLKPSGKGLGLSYAKEIIEAHGGQVGIKSTLGEGSSVSLTIRNIRVDQNESTADKI